MTLNPFCSASVKYFKWRNESPTELGLLKLCGSAQVFSKPMKLCPVVFHFTIMNIYDVFTEQIDEDKRKDSTFFSHRGRYDKKVSSSSCPNHYLAFKQITQMKFILFGFFSACYIERAETPRWRFY